MEKYINNSTTTAANIACVGLGWFPKHPGGVDRYVYELTHHLAATGDHVKLYALDVPDTEHSSSIELINLAAHDSPMWQRLWSIRQNFSSQPVAKLDAINLHFALYSLPLLQTLPAQVPVTFTFHGPWALESEQEGVGRFKVFLKQWLVEKPVHHRCDRFIVLSKAFGNILNQTYQVPWNKIHIIPGGVDLERFQVTLSRQQARQQLNWPQDRIILFTPRRLVNRMGIDKLLLALAKIKHRLPDIWLAIAGKGPLKSTLEQQAIELGLGEYVKFLGFLPDKDLPVAYQASDLTVMPSQALEGFGLTLVESLASGTPVVCTPVGGMPEVLTPFSPDLITTSSEVTALAERLEALLTGQVAMPSRAACHQYAAQQYDWRHIARQVRQVLLA